MQRSVERVEGVRKIDFDLNTGRGILTFEPGKTVAPAALWQAIKESGFTPTRVETKGEVYERAE
ncbi:MAG: heavy-metal-associated domain-containing protein [Planctomycetes bacterium]|nr:heavy-metal-associated domain-containing protein [Planctomycetota bacterium]